jgi:hypothetical protein
MEFVLWSFQKPPFIKMYQSLWVWFHQRRRNYHLFSRNQYHLMVISPKDISLYGILGGKLSFVGSFPRQLFHLYFLRSFFELLIWFICFFMILLQLQLTKTASSFWRSILCTVLLQLIGTMKFKNQHVSHILQMVRHCRELLLSQITIGRKTNLAGPSTVVDVKDSMYVMIQIVLSILKYFATQATNGKRKFTCVPYSRRILIRNKISNLTLENVWLH